MDELLSVSLACTEKSTLFVRIGLAAGALHNSAIPDWVAEVHSTCSAPEMYSLIRTSSTRCPADVAVPTSTVLPAGPSSSRLSRLFLVGTCRSLYDTGHAGEFGDDDSDPSADAQAGFLVDQRGAGDGKAGSSDCVVRPARRADEAKRSSGPPESIRCSAGTHSGCVGIRVVARHRHGWGPGEVVSTDGQPDGAQSGPARPGTRRPDSLRTRSGGTVTGDGTPGRRSRIVAMTPPPLRSGASGCPLTPKKPLPQ